MIPGLLTIKKKIPRLKVRGFLKASIHLKM